jgi:hypothetical protein
MLALAAASSLEVRPYTWLSPRTAPGDRELPPVLAAEVDMAHHVLPDRGLRRERGRLIAAHAGAGPSRGDTMPLLRGSRTDLTGVAFGGHGFALATGFWRVRDLPAEPPDSVEAARMLCALFGERSNSRVGAGMREWAEWAFLHPEPGFDWRDRFYLEQRQAGWLAAKEQAFDLAPLTRVMVLNAAGTYRLLLGFDEDWRTSFGLQKELIRRVEPSLLRHPFNPPASSFGAAEATRARLRGLIRSARHLMVRVRKRVAGD